MSHLQLRVTGMVVAFTTIIGPAAAQSVLRVPATHPTIPAAISAASNGDQILVAPGTYQVSGLDLMGKRIELRSTGGAASTILDGGSAGRILDCASGEAAGTRVQGFTFRNGSGSRGGGISVTFGNGLLSHLDVVDCVFENNAITFGGGGAISIGSGAEARVQGCTFTNNSGAGGAAIAVFGDRFSPSVAWIEGCTFSGNQSDVSGGSVSTSDDCVVDIVSCLFSGNRTVGTAAGAGIYVSGQFGGSPVARITGCTLADNVGSAVFCAQGGTVEMRNSIVWGNTATAQLDVLSFFSAVLFDIEYCDIQGPLPMPSSVVTVAAANNLSVDPLFTNPAADDFTLQMTSPMIDAGDPSRVLQGTDAYGDTRVADGDGDGGIRADIGADEVLLFAMTATANALVAGQSITFATQLAPGVTPQSPPILMLSVNPADDFLPEIGQLRLDQSSLIVADLPGNMASASRTLTYQGGVVGTSIYLQAAQILLDNASVPRVRLSNSVEVLLD